MIIKRDLYLEKLKNRMHNGMIKVITGIRRCGKSFLIFDLFYDHLKQIGVDESHIIKIQLDDIKNIALRDPIILYKHILSKIVDKNMYYILLDEVQYVPNFEEVLNSFLHIKNVDTYVTGSNAKFLSKDIITEFRGRGDQVHVYPLSFSEFLSCYDSGNEEQAWHEYMTFGGLPHIVQCKTSEEKADYLKNLFYETYIKDVLNRNKLKNEEHLDEILKIIASSIGSLTNPNKLSNTFKSEKKISLSANTIKEYLDFLCDSFIVEKAMRYDIRGKKYIATPYKYYFTDIGLRNAFLNFRQMEENHIMENVIYNDLQIKGYNTDVGVVTISVPNEKGIYVRKQLEIDFVCNQISNRYYIQVALNIDTREKMAQEELSLKKVKDSFKKIIVVKNALIPYRNEDGILIMGIVDFLKSKKDLEKL